MPYYGIVSDLLLTDTPNICGSVHGPSPICHSENAYTLSL